MFINEKPQNMLHFSRLYNFIIIDFFPRSLLQQTMSSTSCHKYIKTIPLFYLWGLQVTLWWSHWGGHIGLQC